MKSIIAILILLGTAAHAVGPVYTLIESRTYKYDNGLECELAVAMDAEHTQIVVVRLDSRKGKYTVNGFAQIPGAYHNYGVAYDLDSEFHLSGRSVQTVQAAFELNEHRYDLKVRTIVVDPGTGAGETMERTFSLESIYFKDHPRTCLKAK